MFDLNQIGRRIAELRGRQSQEELAEDIGISDVTLCYYEHGKRTVRADILYNICEHFGVSADWLLGLSKIKERTD